MVARYDDVSVFGLTFVLTQEALEYALWMTFSQGHEKGEVEAAVISGRTLLPKCYSSPSSQPLWQLLCSHSRAQ